MPQLVPFTAKGTFQPDEKGTQANLLAGRRIGTFYDESAAVQGRAARAEAEAAGDEARSVQSITSAVASGAKQYEDYLGHKEVSKGAAAGASLYSGLTDEWDRRVK